MTAPPAQTALGMDCYETALCLVPPEACWPPVERLRALYDKAYRKWPPHVNLAYPFVRPERLDEAVERVQSAIQQSHGEDTPIDIRLDAAGVFHQRHEKTLFLHDGRDDGDDGSSSSSVPLRRLRRRILAAVAGRPVTEEDSDRGDSYTMHMTVAQTSGGGVPGREAEKTDDATAVPTDSQGHAHRYLRHKVELLPAVAWQADRLHILVRERRTKKDGEDEGGAGVAKGMRLWGVLRLADGTLERFPSPQSFYEQLSSKKKLVDEDDQEDFVDETEEEEEEDDDDDDDAEALESFNAVTFEPEEDEWVRCSDDYGLYDDEQADAPAATLAVASYNVLGEFTWPPSRARVPLLVRALLAADAAADVVVLQEVTDDFLSALLADYGVRAAYPFASHGPPDQADMEPLPSLLNTVVLSRRPFAWSWLGFARAHKGAVVARWGAHAAEDRYSLVVATTHLTHGLTDGSVASKRAQLTGLLRHLQQRYPARRAATVVVAGDLNIHTSAHAVEQAQRRKAISPHTAQYVTAGFDSLLARHGFVDAWAVVSKRQGDDDKDSTHHDALYDGEAGATYDPFTNALAAWVIGNGPNDRPERFDRILVRKPAKAEADDADDDDPQPPLVVSGFNQFGFPDATDGQAAHDRVASDHWGIRCVLARRDEDEEEEGSIDSAAPPAAANETGTAPSGRPTTISPEVAALVVPVVAVRAPAGALADAAAVEAALAALGAVPSDEEAARRQAALALLRAVLVEEGPQTPPQPLVLVPVGSYGLGVWTPASDMDCLCIGVIAPATFFALVAQRLRRRAATSSRDSDSSSSIRLLRRVRALSGTMLELRVGGLRVDLQYCQATVVAETWPAALVLPPAHALFALPRQTLAKLKAARDLYRLRQAFPETAGDALCSARTFRTAHRAVKTWARARGLYEARFGYLSGMQISLLLARVMRLMQPLEPGTYTVADLLVTFFRHYAAFDWPTQIAFDPFFHTHKDFYVRTAREPVAILGYHRPQLNTAGNASVPSMRVLADEFRRAGRLLEHGDLTWETFLHGGGDPEPTPAATAASLLPPGPASFVRAYRSYVRIDVQYWGLSQSRGVAYVGWLESRCVLLLVDMARRLPELTARIWPARFVAEDAAQGQGQGEGKGDGDGTGATHQYQGCYLIGLDLPAALSRDARHAALARLQEVLAHFEKQMTTGAGDQYDPQWQWLSVRVVRQAELAGSGPLQLDQSDWGVYGGGEEEGGEEEEEDEDEDEGDDDDHDDDHDDKVDRPPPKAKTPRKDKKDRKKTPMAVVHHPGRAGRFRSAHDVLTRLRWDPHLAVADYVVGYEDRFLGARERAVAAWKTEQQDEEFIPQHRILYFKRADGVVVWDRRTRKDELFGSGREQVEETE